MATAATDGVDLETRRPVWVALSEFFLDTELDDGDLERIADLLATSPYSLEELETIYRDETAPVLWHNLNVPAGVWDAFDPDWLCAEAAKRAEGPSLTLRAAKSVGVDRAMTHATDELWSRTAAKIERLRNE